MRKGEADPSGHAAPAEGRRGVRRMDDHSDMGEGCA